MGLLDLPIPALSWLDMALAGSLPAAVRIAVWGGVGAVVSMGVYWLVSPQRRIARVAAEERQLKDALRNANTEMADGMAAARRLLSLALTRLGLVLLPVVVAALPVLCLMTWLQTHYAHEMPPPGQTAAVKVAPATVHGRWIGVDNGPPRIDVMDHRGLLVQSLAISAPVPIIRKRVWWNALIGNPLGYLPDEGPVERVEIGLPERRYLPIGPNWIRGWEALFIAALMTGSLLLKYLFRIR